MTGRKLGQFSNRVIEIRSIYFHSFRAGFSPSQQKQKGFPALERIKLHSKNTSNTNRDESMLVKQFLLWAETALEREVGLWIPRMPRKKRARMIMSGTHGNIAASRASVNINPLPSSSSLSSPFSRVRPNRISLLILCKLLIEVKPPSIHIFPGMYKRMRREIKRRERN